MARKHTSSVLTETTPEAEASGSTSTTKPTTLDVGGHIKKARRVSDASFTDSEDKENQRKPQSWKDIKLVGEDEGEVPIYDDCAEIRRKIRRLQKTPGFKLTQWLRDIGNINSNSYGRFMRYSGRDQGAANGTYYAAYVYFEKMRIFENKKKTPTRLANERQLGRAGFSRETPSHWIWVRDGEYW